MPNEDLAGNFGNTEVHSPHEEIPIEAEAYLQIVQHSLRGPQIEGIDPRVYVEVMADPSTHKLQINDDVLGDVELPLFVQLDFAPWINKQYLAEKGYNESNLYFCALPQAFLAEKGEEVSSAIDSFHILTPDASILVDYPESVTPFHEKENANLAIADDLITANGTPAATYHYTMDFSPVEGGIDPASEQTSIHKVEDDAFIYDHMDRIWEIYSQQFKALVDDHPIEGALPRDELYQTLVSQNSSLYVYVNNEGRVDAFGYLVDNLELCPWLNQDYYESKEPSLPTFYMPGIAAAPDCERSVGVDMMERLLRDNLGQIGEWRVTFECSNISAMYIPKLVQRTVDRTDGVQASALNEVRHFYKVVSSAQ